jgi:hypothetical protein
MWAAAGVLAAGLATGGAARAATLASAKGMTAHYKLELDVGGPEKMYSKAEAARMKPAAGEIMVSGAMADGMPGMPAPPSGGMAAMETTRHLELHVRDKASGKAVEGARVHITVRNAAGGEAMTVPVAVMYGIAEGETDWHYGNNVDMPPGRYVVNVSANGETAQFTVTVPKG